MIPTFRVWDKTKKRMYDVMQMDWDGGLRFSVVGTPVNRSFRCGIAGFSDKMILMQSTGLKDKRGNEIFEGDIIEASGAKKNPWKVEWLQRISGYQLTPCKHLSGCMNLLESCCERYKVIGNIHESKELLK